MTDSQNFRLVRKGRGAASNPDNRFDSQTREAVDDGWGGLDEPLPPLKTSLGIDSARRVITYNTSPDVPFDRSINPYRGCEHGCVYCFARPTHAYLGLSPGLDFETRLFHKPDAPLLLRKELAKKSYRCQPIALGINTDAYQPVERRLNLTRGTLEVLAAHRHPVTMVTKSALVERDMDILAEMARDNLVHVALSITTLDAALSRRLEPRAAAPQRRLETVRNLSRAGIPVGVLVAPVIPVLTDGELERILEASRQAGAAWAGYVLLRLPHELKDLVREWLEMHEPLKADHVMNRVYDSRGGKAYDATFGTRMRGVGVYAELIAKRFRLAHKRLAFSAPAELETALFTPVTEAPPQLDLF